MKRSNKPVFWSLFGAGGMLSALVAPALITVTGFRGGVPGYERALAFAQSAGGKLALLLVISLFLFHGCHRMYHLLHDFGIHVGPGRKALFHGFAVAGTLAALYALVLI